MTLYPLGTLRKASIQEVCPTEVVLEQYQVTVDNANGIRNEPNDWCWEHNDLQYILRLVGQVVWVSVETVVLLKGLPGLEA